MESGYGKMNIKGKSFFSGFLVLGFAFFLLGFLAGMLAIAFIPIKSDVTVTLLVFILSFLTGIITITLVLIALKVQGLSR